ncbi:Smy1p KNAG_0H00360 [Huiozyma naganishii CBS 8797]|uniref:Kinesin motor domain-containing protein n=1 Tax=Huiozyma naganishii (strain ATCC MYA-139 / BCRC 22969 / CBS 8797 / KCTC 17520 / NBRC 10181 / NCYC 3082 / Yp74L-3) TaxID=1071383 RepID=J7S1G6_HUIN7|nr:hypothetical protein KNAG_0H00360 [Kazachstania naganishii CBS 8797]CCK71452.1 hypothetical protein KNAG_0H00360 [Kazachstania naganishii CBS 8797]
MTSHWWTTGDKSSQGSGYWNALSKRDPARDVESDAGSGKEFKLPKWTRVGQFASPFVLLDIQRDSNEAVGNSNHVQTVNDTVVKLGEQSFSFSKVLNDQATKTEQFTELASKVTDDVLSGINCCVTTYGSGLAADSLVMFGPQSGNSKEEQDSSRCSGLLQQTCKHIFNAIDSDSTSEYQVSLSLCEVYVDKVFDLLVPVRKRKPLKLQHPSLQNMSTDYLASQRETNVYVVRDLHSVVLCRFDDLLTYVNEINSAYHQSKKSHIFVRMKITQVNELKDTLKEGIVQFVNLASDFKDSPGISQEESKKSSAGVALLREVVADLSSDESKASRYKEAHLTKLMYEPLMVNFKTSFVLCCSNNSKNRNDTLQLLQFGAQLQQIRTQVSGNVFGLNSKRKMELYLSDMKLKEENYKERIRFLQRQLESSKNLNNGTAGTTSNKPANPVMDRLMKIQIENFKLKEQVKLLHSLKKAKASGETFNEEKIMQTLLEKCEQLATLQIEVDDEGEAITKLNGKLKLIEEKDHSLEKMNAKLVEQMNFQEQSLEKVIEHNSVLVSELNHWKNLITTQKDNIEALEEKLKRLGIAQQNQMSNSLDSAAFDRQRKHSVHSSNTHSPHKEDTPTATLWAAKRAHSSDPATATSQSKAPNRSHKAPRPIKKGLKLNSIRVVSNLVSNSTAKEQE